MSKRRKSREVALKVLFQTEMASCDAAGALDDAARHANLDADGREFSEKLCKGVLESIEQLDERIGKVCENWELSRLATVDRNILRLAAYEMLCEDTPHAVVINEAVELAKRFSTAESGKFVNGVLGRLFDELEAESKTPSGRGT